MSRKAGNSWPKPWTGTKNSSNTVTLKDIAREAGVSVALVSFVMNNRMQADGKPKYRVGEATRERILEVAGRLGYRHADQPHPLTKGETPLAVIVLPEPGRYADTSRDWEKRLYQKGYSVVFAYTWNDPERFGRLVALAQGRAVDKIIVAPPPEGSATYWETLRESGIPVEQMEAED